MGEAGWAGCPPSALSSIKCLVGWDLHGVEGGKTRYLSSLKCPLRLITAHPTTSLALISDG